MKGKHICKTLKEIRLSVAQANDIDYTPAECNHKGDCAGTCPQCEKEVRYIERQLLRRQAIGKAAVIAGLALGATSIAPAMAQTQDQPTNNITHSQEPELLDFALNDNAAIIVKGYVIDKDDNEPLVGATIVLLDKSNKSTKYGTATNIDGRFAIRVPKGTKVNISSVGYESVIMVLNEPNDNLVIKMEGDNPPIILGYVMPLSSMPDVDADIYEMK